MRVKAVPFSVEVQAFIQNHDRLYVIEMNRDGQLHQLLSLEYPELVSKLISLAYTDGLPLTARRVRESILAKEDK
jgi:2-oxoglutarate ferredoxin oxidoreductase subunit alpha